MSRGNPNFAEYGFKKGDGRGGRPKGAPNKTTRVLQEAIILAAEKSKHSKAHDLEGYLLYLADDKPELFVPLLAKLLPLQVRAKNEDVGPVNLNLNLNPNLNPNMSLSEMINNFERRIKSIHNPLKELAPPMIEQD
jgi:hypothetical protein